MTIASKPVAALPITAMVAETTLDHSRPGKAPPIIARADHGSPSVFRPENMLREARRQKRLALGTVPAVCLLDPDGDIVTHVRDRCGARPSPYWACYHTQLWEWEQDGLALGVVGCAVGASFAVLVAEQLFVSGCRTLISLASAGRIADSGHVPSYIIVDRALRDEGTSYHYLPPSTFADADPELVARAADALRRFAGVGVGATWTTDAPFRETAEIIAARQRDGILAVEMEAAALYAFAQSQGKPVICLSHVTNELGQVEGDFDKGEANGAGLSLTLVLALAKALSS
jgi:uridine phosphorylase